ncbi:MAG: DUF971 domain-containing protein [Acidimicrobiales bacterium]|nr:DUF971 domain-containing protein [Acidimicrobiales bacterium]
MDDRFEPLDIHVKRTEGVTITFADDFVAEFNLVALRLRCPCAECRSLRDRGEESWPRPGSPIPLEIATAEMHGAWGLSPTWNDGHTAGIYPFDALRNWADSEGTSPRG